MSLKVTDIINIMEKIAPTQLKESYDNVGLMVGDKEAMVSKVLVALDCTLEVIDEGKKLGVDMILTHHPLIFKKPSSITTDTLQGRKIIELIKNDINLYSSHTNWDAVENGFNDTIVSILGFGHGEIMDINSLGKNTGVGRIVKLEEEKSLKYIIEIVKDQLNIGKTRYTGELHKKIKKIAIINGSGEDYFERAIELGADLVITGDTTYHFVSDYTEMGLSILDIGHFNSEWPVLVYLSLKLKKLLNKNDVELIISENIKDPYKFI